jgi:hypothetical protein
VAHMKTSGSVHPELLKAWQDRALKAQAEIEAYRDALTRIANVCDHHDSFEDALWDATNIAEKTLAKRNGE